MDENKLYQVMKRTEAILNSSDEKGLLATAHDLQKMSDTELEFLLKEDGLESKDVNSAFKTMGLEVSWLRYHTPS